MPCRRQCQISCLESELCIYTRSIRLKKKEKSDHRRFGSKWFWTLTKPQADDRTGAKFHLLKLKLREPESCWKIFCGCLKLHLSNLLTVLIKSCQACFLCPVPTVRCNSCLYLCSNFLAELKIGFKRCMYSYASLMSQSEYSPWNVAIHFCTSHYKLYKVQFHANSLHFNFKQSWKAGLLNEIYSCK